MLYKQLSPIKSALYKEHFAIESVLYKQLFVRLYGVTALQGTLHLSKSNSAYKQLSNIESVSTSNCLI